MQNLRRAVLACDGYSSVKAMRRSINFAKQSVVPITSPSNGQIVWANRDRAGEGGLYRG